MKSLSLLPVMLAFPVLLAAQDVPPPDFAANELERSRACVPALDHLTAVEARLDPLARRAERINELSYAIAMEASARAAPFDDSDPIEAAVQQWFDSDGALAARRGEGDEEAIDEERARGRQAIRQQLAEELDDLNEESREILEEAGDVETAVQECDGAILVRSVVLDVCEGGSSLVCEQAREPATLSAGRFRFVDEPEELWDMEEMRPWSAPTSLHVTDNGGLDGARTAALARRGNLVFVMGLEPMILDRSNIEEEQATEFDANLDSLGFSFDDPRFVMAPALSIRFDATKPVGGETHYLLHFGDLSNPGEDVIWSAPSAGEPLSAVFPATAAALDRLAAGEPVSLTAVSFLEDDSFDGDAIFSIPLTPIGQSESVSGLLSYMASGQLSTDLAALVPPLEAEASR